MSGPGEVLLRLWPVPSAPADARHAVRDFCAARALAHVADDAELLTSELVTNAARHATTLITLLAMEQDSTLVVTVSDDGDGVDGVATQLPDPAAEHGRGLYVVDQIAGEWGTTRHETGHTVWFRLP